MTILETIAEKTKERVASAKAKKPLPAMQAEALALPLGDFPFDAMLDAPGLSFLCEVKKASPSKGLIAAEFDPVKTAKQYAAFGADGISVLTEPAYFQGSDEYLRQIAAETRLPLLRKDFIVDEYMLFEAKLLGASAVLLIAALLPRETLAAFRKTAEALGLSALIEVHNEAELENALFAEAKIVGVNNRDLHTFHVDLAVSERLSAKIPKNVRFISESGIRTAADIARLAALGADGVLIGETLMRAENPGQALAQLRQGAKP